MMVAMWSELADERCPQDSSVRWPMPPQIHCGSESRANRCANWSMVGNLLPRDAGKEGGAIPINGVKPEM